ncbi:gp53-like domain-containing protein [Pseudomonas sp. TWP3-2]|uniref:gp53-like domain-containing protein n=1 Tax=Pseudomonas sp. TWP3-2 TaxID=2804574 RepID=UPI003CEA437A
MDYPKSVPGVGLVNGQFVDEDPIAGKPGSLIPATWGNSVTQEVLSVVQAAGMTPNEASSNQLLGALRSSRLFSTAPQFDTGKAVATAEFVQRALGNHANAKSLIDTAQLTAADVGCAFGLGGTTAYTVTLPEVSSVPDGATLSFHCLSNSVITIASKAGAQICPQGAYLTSITINGGESAQLVKGYGVWTVHGTASLKYANAFGLQLATAGYQKLPSGLVFQWAVGGSDASGIMTISLPIRFQTAIVGGVADEGNPAGWSTGNTTVWAFDLAASTTSVAVARVRNVAASSVRPDPGIMGRILVWGK